MNGRVNGKVSCCQLWALLFKRINPLFILRFLYHRLTLGTSYEEARYDQYNPRQEARERQRAFKALERLGYTVTLERAA